MQISGKRLEMVWGNVPVATYCSLLGGARRPTGYCSLLGSAWCPTGCLGVLLTDATLLTGIPAAASPAQEPLGYLRLRHATAACAGARARQLRGL
jgi:hypothetical protein